MYNKEKSGATFMSHRFLCVYKYRLNGNVGVIFLQGQGEPCILLLSTEEKNQYDKHSLNHQNKRIRVHQNYYYYIQMSNRLSEYSKIQILVLQEGIKYYQYIQG